METTLYWMQSPAGQMGAPAQLGGIEGNWMRSQTKYLFFFNVFLFLAALGLHCCVWAFSSCSVQELLSSRGAKASHCGGFSC